MSSVVAVGSVAIDSVKTPFGARERSIGGSATHFSVAASFFSDVSVVGIIGDDFTEEDMSVFRARRIDTADLERVPGGKTFFWEGEYGFDLNTAHTLDTQLNVFADFQPKLSEQNRKAPYLFLGNIQPTLQREVRQQVDARFVAMDTMNFWIETARDELVKTIGVVDALVINDAEARQLVDEPNLIKAAKMILDMGPSTLIIKRGEYGAACFTRDSFFATPAYPLEGVFDPTGAGDSFAGGLMGYLAQADNLDDMTIRRGIMYGSVMASFNVEEFSCDRLLEMGASDVHDRLTEFKEFTHFDIGNGATIRSGAAKAAAGRN